MKRLLKSIINQGLRLFNLQLINTKYRQTVFEKNEQMLSLNFDHVLSDYILNHSNAAGLNFIQIGAYDGIMHDPLRKYLENYNWAGIMVEPQPLPFSKLTNLYSGRENITLLNGVVSEKDGMSMYVVAEQSSYPEWLKGSASFYKQNLLKYRDQFPNIENDIEEIRVNSFSVDELVQINKDRFIDLLLIDAEGYDGILLKQFLAKEVTPAIIRFECKNISTKALDCLLQMLLMKNYRIAYDGGQEAAEDIIAVFEK